MSREDSIRIALQSLKPVMLKIVNESSGHRGHHGDDGSGETHFHLSIVAECFRGLTRIEQHRLVYTALREQLNSGIQDGIQNGIHALSLETVAPGPCNRSVAGRASLE